MVFFLALFLFNLIFISVRLKVESRKNLHRTEYVDDCGIYNSVTSVLLSKGIQSL